MATRGAYSSVRIPGRSLMEKGEELYQRVQIVGEIFWPLVWLATTGKSGS